MIISENAHSATFALLPRSPALDHRTIRQLIYVQ